ncbi:hypothetical protein [Secundilactobacillus paracollinoides]
MSGDYGSPYTTSAEPVTGYSATRWLQHRPMRLGR